MKYAYQIRLWFIVLLISYYSNKAYKANQIKNYYLDNESVQFLLAIGNMVSKEEYYNNKVKKYSQRYNHLFARSIAYYKKLH